MLLHILDMFLECEHQRKYLEARIVVFVFRSTTQPPKGCRHF